MRLHELFEASGWTAAKVKDEIKQDISYGSSGDVHPYFRRLDQDKAAVTALKYLNQNKTLSHALSMAYQEQGMSAIDSDARSKIYGPKQTKKGTGKGKKCGDCGGTGKKGVNTCGTCGGLGIIPGGGPKRKDDKEKAGGGEKKSRGAQIGNQNAYKGGSDKPSLIPDFIKKHEVGGGTVGDRLDKDSPFSGGGDSEFSVPKAKSKGSKINQGKG